ncbi:MAG: tyrosine-type recombinase/integrase [Lachnospiraceae bacterium]
MANKTYSEQQNIQNTKKLNELLKVLPRFSSDYFQSVQYTKLPRTQLAYAMDLKNFFEFLVQNNPIYKDKTIHDIQLNDMNMLVADDIVEYLRYVKAYSDPNGREITNAERSAKRKLSSLRSFFGYYYKMDKISVNPTMQVDMPKIHEKAIVRMEVNEVAQFLDNVESGNKLTPSQLKRHEKLKVRDLALLSLMLGTGIRVSECVGLDINDVDFDNNRIKVVRKGGYEDFVYFSDEVSEILQEYMDERKGMTTEIGHENALFISSKKTRLCVRSVELLVKKYANTVTTVKHITPHKLRSTYGTNLYQESKDIYLVADVLGHKDVNTTRKHYAEIVDENKRRARNKVKLRKDD